MFGRPSTMILVWGVAGTIAAGLVWISLADSLSGADDIEAASEALAVASHHYDGQPQSDIGKSFAAVIANPLFAVSAGPHAVRDVSIRLLGLAVVRGHGSALLAIDGQPPTWLDLGATRSQVTLTAVTAHDVTVDTPIGSKTVSFNDGAVSPQPLK